MDPADEHLAKSSRMLRQRQSLKQVDLIGPGRSRHFTRRLEAGMAGKLRLHDLREHFARLGARVRVSVWWNGAAMDRLLDARHAALVERTIDKLRPYGWRTEAEVTFSEYGERGSIDVFAGLEQQRALFVGEVKSEWGSLEETLRRLDVKARLAPQLCRARLGWQPLSVGLVLVLPEDRTARRVAQRHAQTLDSALPDRNKQVRRWLREPTGPLRALWFLTDVHDDGYRRGS
jgi:hypothetical protein